jgi:EAL domain-containing protein (putative c-di-GMP-specific phosphodiesterase class I)
MTPDSEVRDLLLRGFVSTAFQPIIHLNSGKVVGYESLMRGPADTILSNPGYVFGPTSQVSTHLIRELDVACVAASFRSGRLLVPFGQLFVNIHISTLMHISQWQDHFRKLLDTSGIPPQAVVIEISERSTTHRPRVLSRILRLLRREGFRFALDDFGLAYSGLQHLYWLEPEYVKLDRAFILGIQRSARKQALVASVTAMCQKLGSQVIAEGVENTEELLTLMALDIPMAQGFHFGRPQAALFWTSERATNTILKPWYKASRLLNPEETPRDEETLSDLSAVDSSFDLS